MVLLLLFACAREPSPTAPILALDADAERGRAPFQMECARCHGQTGQGVGRTPALSERVPHIPDEQIVDAVINGRPTMPRVTALTEQQVADVTAYLRATFDPAQ